MKTGIELIAIERDEQVSKHKLTTALDVRHNKKRQLRAAAHALIGDKAIMQQAPDGWSKVIWKKMIKKPVKQRLIIAAALIAAEIDRIQNQP